MAGRRWWGRYRGMILTGVLFFYLGCGLTLSLLRADVSCAGAGAGAREGAGAARERVEYAVLVLSSPAHERERDAARATWVGLLDNLVTDNGERLYRWSRTRRTRAPALPYAEVLFAVGTLGASETSLQRLHDENDRTGDLILLENVEEGYDKLTEKLLESLKWLNVNLTNLKYVVKCDDDSFVRADLIIAELDANGHNINVPQMKKDKESKVFNNYKGLYWGYFDGRARAFLSGKWKEEDWFLCDNYLPYTLGGGYVISKSIVAYIANNADMLSLYNSEDVTMGVWTAALKQINRVHDIRFDTEWKSRGCQKDLLVRHKQSIRDMFDMYSTLVSSKGKTLCKTETVGRKAYQYNWRVLPSMCCKPS